MKRFDFAPALVFCVGLTCLGCSNSDRELAIELIQQAGGTLSYDDQGRITSVDLSDSDATDEELAAVSMFPHVQSVNCNNAPGVTGSDLDLLVDCPRLAKLYLVGTKLDDVGLSRMKDLTSLQTLNLDGTAITDRGMPALDNLVNLRTLVLGNTAITDRGLVQLRDLRNLSTLVLRNTRTTPGGVKELERMLPEVRIVD